MMNLAIALYVVAVVALVVAALKQSKEGDEGVNALPKTLDELAQRRAVNEREITASIARKRVEELHTTGSPINRRGA